MPVNLLLADDERHEMLRKHLAPAFTGRAIEEVEPVLQKYTDELMRQYVFLTVTLPPRDRYLVGNSGIVG